MKIKFRHILFGLAAVLVFASCNKSLVENNDSKEIVADTAAREKKVLLIMVDGAVGNEFRTLALPTLKSLEQNSIYSYDGLNSINNEKISTDQSWASIMTGVTADKHEVTSDVTANNFDEFPSFITRLKQVEPGFKVVTIAADSRISSSLFTNADEKNVYANNDAEVNNKAKATLQSADADMVIVHFNSPNQAGLSSSFSATSSAYAQAAQNIDSYIRQQIDVVKARPGYAHEDWLIMIVSTVGSNQQASMIPWNAFEDKNHNTLYFFYNPRFQLRSYSKPSANTNIPYIGMTPSYIVSGPASTQYAYMDSAVNDDDLDFGTTGSFTVQCKVKMPTGTQYYPSFFGKRASFDGTSAGWLFFLEGNGWGFNVSQGGGNRQVVTGTAINDGKWHTLNGVVKFENSVRTIAAFLDGVKIGQADITNWNLNTTARLRAGWNAGSNGGTGKSMNITDIRIYNVALPDAYISSNYCTVDIPTADAYYNNLLGFWPSLTVMQDFQREKYLLRDHSTKDRPLVIQNYIRNDFNDSQFGVCPPLSTAVYNMAPLAIDVANQVYSWFGVPVRPSWNLDGKSWIPSYSDNN